MLEKFTVIDLIKTRSASIITFSANTVKFNVQTAQELEFPQYIQFLVNAKDKQVAIRACKENDPNSVPLCKDGTCPKYGIRFSQPVVTNIVRKLTGWQETETWNVPAVFFADEKALIYDLGAAFAPTSRKGGWATKRENEAAAIDVAQKLDAEP